MNILGRYMKLWLRRLLCVFSLLISLLMLVPSSVVWAGGIRILLHSVSVTPMSDSISYQVTANFSVIDEENLPIKGLRLENVRLFEDSKAVIPKNLEILDHDPIHVIVLLDISRGFLVYNKTIQEAAVSFVQRLSSGDQVGVYTFAREIRLVQDVTDNLDLVKSRIRDIRIDPGDTSLNGTCLYDALYKSLEKASILPSGRRAIVVLTDGWDELPDGRVCSSHSLDEVINLGASGSTRTPLYLLGFGKKIDDKVLSRLAISTNGDYVIVKQANDLQSLFGKIADQLKSQYQVTYISESAPGDHTLTLQVLWGSMQDQATYRFVLPEMLPIIRVIQPKDGELVQGIVRFQIDIRGKRDLVKRIRYEVNGRILKEEINLSETELDFSAYPEGDITVNVVGLNEKGEEVARGKVRLGISLPVQQTPTVKPGLQDKLDEKNSQVTGIDLSNLASYYKYGLGLGLALVVLLFAAFAWVRVRKQAATKKDIGTGHQSSTDDRTLDGIIAVPGVLEGNAELIVLFSDEPGLIGTRYPLNFGTTRLGRQADNDIVFKNDQPVSRHHAIIQFQDGRYILSEAVKSEPGQSVKAPTYGTYVNGRRIYEPVVLKNGDEIQLGKRLRLRFEQKSEKEQHHDFDTSSTIDGFRVDEPTIEV